MNRAAPNCFMRRHAAALAQLIAPFATTGRAEAACTPALPVNTTTVTCTGATINQNDPNGYGTAGDTGNTINVQSGASVTGVRLAF